MKKGFTLIELLAVIIILAILMIIAVPNILSTLAAAREQAFVTQAQSIYKSVEKKYLLDNMIGSGGMCYDKENSNIGSISDSVSFRAAINPELGEIDSLEVIDSGQEFRATATDVNNVEMGSYSNSSVSCSGYVYYYKEKLLNGADPVLNTGLIPVKLSGTSNNWTVEYADTTKRWYKYGNSEWANAVKLIETPSKTYEAGDIIAHSDIDGYFVWIPKYDYQLFNLGDYSSNNGTTSSANQLINIRFGGSNTTDTNDSCATPMTSGASGNCAVNKWMSHPAFVSLGKRGFWVGKFEATGSYDLVDDKPVILSLNVLPNADWNAGSLQDTFTKSLSYAPGLDSHMLKNTEWGAVAYLSNSNYGRGNSDVWENKEMKTGKVTNPSTSSSINWYTSTGSQGSTSGNITGVFDMSGGVYERVAAVKNGATLQNNFSLSSYNSKYYDLYDSNSSLTSYNKRILGDATGEMGPFNSSNRGSWFNSYSEFSNFAFIRGGFSYSSSPNSDGGSRGLYYFANFNDEPLGNVGFRIALAP